MVTYINFTLAVLTVTAEALVALFIISRFLKEGNFLRKFFFSYGKWLAFSAALIAVLGSLTYSEIVGYDPCKLCWIQRIFMYPLVLVLGVALWRREVKNLIPYILILAIPGAIVAVSHYYLQVSGVSIFPCDAVGYSAACSQRFVLQFGYITIPMMALSSFLLITVSTLAIGKK
ncbi:MAG: disulfide bond formation protein B [bacterium]|nr:disulfide bond formation protein B [bacterium]